MLVGYRGANEIAQVVETGRHILTQMHSQRAPFAIG